MLPVESGDLRKDFVFGELPTRTYRMRRAGEEDGQEQYRLTGYTDDLEAMRQAILLILSTERYKYIIYSWNYGVELEDLIGRPIPYVLSEIKRRITEALTQDTRITAVTDFDFAVQARSVTATFTARTVFGPVEAERTVGI